MVARLNQPTERRTPLPLTARDLADLAKLRLPGPEREALSDLANAPLAEEVSEALLVHAVFLAGLRAVQEAVEERGYAQLAVQEATSGEAAERRLISQRRPPRSDED